MSKRLEQLRDQVEQVSLEILDALNRRGQLVLEVAREKQALGLPVRDPYRESLLIDRLVEANRGPFDAETVRRVFREILDGSVTMMQDRRRRGLKVGPTGGPRVVVRVKGAAIGEGEPAYIAGPCAVESAEQIDAAARRLSALGVRFLRGGAFKPRTSPYAFQGLGEIGLRLLRDVGQRYGMATVTEATSPENAPLVAEYADVLQIGARNMYNYELLRAVGQTGKPVMLKRAFSATLDEWLNAAEYIALTGNEQIILCERGIRTFSRETRNTLDLSSVPIVLGASRLPVIVDVSHAAGRRDLLEPLTRATFAAGAHGVMIEVHPDPDVALSDADQQITLEAFAALRAAVHDGLARMAAALDPGASAPATPAPLEVVR